MIEDERFVLLHVKKSRDFVWFINDELINLLNKFIIPIEHISGTDIKFIYNLIKTH